MLAVAFFIVAAAVVAVGVFIAFLIERDDRREMQDA
jgi:hypothetical protein